MIQKHLGKIILLITIFTATIFAGVVDATLEKNAIYQGDMAKYTIKAKGKDIEFPQIEKIGDYPIVNTSESSQFVIINGDASQTKTQSYYFKPSKDLIIPSFIVKVDGKEYHTKELQLKVVKPSQSTKQGSEFILEMNVSKKEAKVGEPIELDLKFKIKNGAKVDKINIAPPKLSDFWVKQLPGQKQDIEGNYRVVTYSYLIFPQKSGELKIPATFVQIGKAVPMGSGFDDPFFNNSLFSQIKWSKIYSNSITINVKPLPNNLELYGHFLLTAKTDKTKVNANEPVNLTIKVEGEGNIDDVKKFNLKIPDAMVYANEPEVKSAIVNGKYKGVFTQKIAIVADKNFTIPSLSLSYFDKDLNKSVTVKTNPINIEVVGTPKVSNTPKVEISKTTKKALPQTETKQKVVVKNSNNLWYVYLVVGLILGILLTLIIQKLKPSSKNKKLKPILEQIKKAKSDRELYKLLLPYAKDDEYLKDKLNKLEENIYKGQKNKIDKYELIDYFEQIILS